MVETINKVLRATRKLTNELNREPTVEEIAKEMESPAAKEMLKNVLDEGITIKRGLNQTESVKKQIKMLEEIKGMFKS